MNAILILLIVMYFMPAIIASSRNCHNADSLFFVNLIFGWTVIVWLIVLVLSLTSMPKVMPPWKR